MAGTGYTNRSDVFTAYWKQKYGRGVRMGDTIGGEEPLRILPMITNEEYGASCQNGTREAVSLLRIGESNWTAEQVARAAELEAVEAAIDAIREASNRLEAKPVIPADYTDDLRWP